MGFGIKETLNFVLTGNHFWDYFRLVCVFITLAFDGVVIFSTFLKSRNKFLNVGGGMILGPTVFLFLLGILSYFLKGFTWISVIFFSFTFLCLLIFLKNFKDIKKTYSFHISLNTALVFLITIFYLLFIGFFAKSAPVGGDVTTHWGIATSFARGNYPTVLPWQPNYLTIYHMGAFMVMGAIHAVANVNIYLVHIFFSVYLIWGIFLFVTGLAREKTRSLLCFIPAIFALILFGGPIIYLRLFGDLFLPLTNSISTVFNPRNIPPMLQDFRSSNGSGSSDLGGLVYGNFYTFGFSIFLIFIFLLNKKFSKGNLAKYLLLTVAAVLTLSVDESMFLIELPILVSYFLVDNRKNFLRKGILYGVICAAVFGILFFTIQNPVRDSLLTPARVESRFKLLSPHDLEFSDRVSFVSSRIFSTGKDSWLLPSLPLVIIVILILSVLGRSYFPVSFSISALSSLIFSYLIVNTYWPANGLRFANQSSQILMLAIGFLLIDLLKNRRHKILFPIIILVFSAVFLPQFINDNVNFVNKAKDKKANHFILGYGSRNPAFEWIIRNIPYNKKFLFVDEYPKTSNHSPLSLQATQSYGIFVPSVASDIKIISFEFGGEWYDGAVFLAPEALRKLNIDYVFVRPNGGSFFSEERKIELLKPEYFKYVYSDSEGTLYEVQSAFKNLEDKRMSLETMAKLIPDDSLVYLDRLRFSETRKGFLVLLSKRTKLVGPALSQGGDLFMYIEDFLPLTPTNNPLEMLKSQYIITSGTEGLPKGASFKKIAEIPYVSLWYNASVK